MSRSVVLHPSWREDLRRIIYEADTPAGKAFDVALLLTIVLSVVAVMLETVESIRVAWGGALRLFEWVVTLLFTAEYLLRIACVAQPLRYVRSFFGVVDLLSILPTYLSLLIPGSQSLLVIRALRLLRVFRVFKAARFLGEAYVLVAALRSSLRKVIVFVSTVLIITIITGAAMYLIEGKENGFDSIPRSMYWAIVTMTTVGYGDIAPQTVLGQLLAATLMILGYGIIAVPTGIVSAEMVQASRRPVSTRACPACACEGHEVDALHCRRCGASLAPGESEAS